MKKTFLKRVKEFCYLPIVIQFNTIHLHTINWFQVLLFYTNNYILHTVQRFQVFHTNSFISIQLNGSK